MKIHLLNGATLRPPTGGSIPTQCLLVEHDRGLVLVDAGMSQAHLNDLREISFERFFIRPPQDPGLALVNQVRRLGLDPADVRDIVLTHLHSEHCTGIMDFQHARIHVSAAEHASAMNGSLRSRLIYRRNAWAHGPDWVPHSGDGTWKGVGGTTEVLPGVVMVPLPGHTAGHSGVAVSLGDQWILHAGDAAYADLSNHSMPPIFPLRQYQWVAADNRRTLRSTHRLVERLFRLDDVIPLCSHLPFSTAGNSTIIEPRGLR